MYKPVKRKCIKTLFFKIISFKFFLQFADQKLVKNHQFVILTRNQLELTHKPSAAESINVNVRSKNIPIIFINLFSLVSILNKQYLKLFHQKSFIIAIGCTDESGILREPETTWQMKNDTCQTCSCMNDLTVMCKSRDCPVLKKPLCEDGREPSIIYDIDGCCPSYICSCKYNSQ